MRTTMRRMKKRRKTRTVEIKKKSQQKSPAAAALIAKKKEEDIKFVQNTVEIVGTRDEKRTQHEMEKPCECVLSINILKLYQIQNTINT